MEGMAPSVACCQLLYVIDLELLLGQPVALLAAAACTFVPILVDARRHAAKTYSESPAAFLYRVDQVVKLKNG